MHEGMRGCVGPWVIWAADNPRAIYLKCIGNNWLIVEVCCVLYAHCVYMS